MPELPEVESVVRSLLPHVQGRRIVTVAHVRPDMVRPREFDLSTALAGKTIVNVCRRAKRIVFSLGNGERFFVHLGMTGQLTADDAAKAVPPHTHLIADLDVGPEPLTLRPAVLARQLGGTRRAIKAALLDQTVIAGIGNIYADEALHRAGIHPSRPADSLSIVEVGRLNRAIKAVLNRAIRAGGSSIRDYVNADGERGGFQAMHRVYDREGQPCRGCRGAIVRIVLGGRSTHFCPDCQPATPPAVIKPATGGR